MMMTQRTLATERALIAARQVHSIVNGDLSRTVAMAGSLVAALGDPLVWDGPEAARFRADAAPRAVSGMTQVRDRLEELRGHVEHVLADIVAAGSAGTIGGGRLGAFVVAEPRPPFPTDSNARQTWWNGLGEGDRLTYLKQYPFDLGYLATDGEIQLATGYATMLALYQGETDLEAGVDRGNWDTGKSLADNIGNVRAVYDFYQFLYNSDPNEFQWAGLARLAGAEFFSGMEKAYVAAEFPPPGVIGLPGAVVTQAAGRATEQFLLEGQKRIFSDLAWQHEAYLHGGIAAMDVLERKYGDQFNSDSVNGWRCIANGDVSRGNLLLLKREQQVIVQPLYQESGFDNYLLAQPLSVMAQSPVPEGGGGSFEQYLPGGNIGDFGQRWSYLANDTWPAWERLAASTASRLVNTPLDQRASIF
jgi:hypothetical protein